MISEQQVAAACRIAHQVYSGQVSAPIGVASMTSDFGLNETSARIFIDDYRHLMLGRVFKRTMSAFAMRYFIEHISVEHGPHALALAVASLRAHIEYFEGHYKTTMHAQRAVVARFESA
jgi:5-methylcytosine-specific restriction protein A